MKILAFADIHGNENLINEIIKKARAQTPDLIISTGDFSIFGDNTEKILSKFDSLNIPFIIIPGNHEEIFDLKKKCNKFKNIIYLHKGTYEFGNYLFLGFGTGGFSSKSPEFEKMISLASSKLKNKKIILITHQPPYGNKLDFLDFFEYVGNNSYRKFIEEYTPDFAISGHLHENFGKMDKIGKTILINPGPLGRIIEV